MSEVYYKAFKKNNQAKFIEYDPKKSKYLSFIDRRREHNEFQIIINSKLMLDIAEEVISKDLIVKKLTIDENSFIEIDDLHLDNIDNFSKFKEVKKNLLFNDNNFIEIKKMSVLNIEDNYDFSIQSNGILMTNEEDCRPVKKLIEKIMEKISIRWDSNA